MLPNYVCTEFQLHFHSKQICSSKSTIQHDCHIKLNIRLPGTVQSAQRFQSTTLQNLRNLDGAHNRKRSDVMLLSCKPAKKLAFSYQLRQLVAILLKKQTSRNYIPLLLPDENSKLVRSWWNIHEHVSPIDNTVSIPEGDKAWCCGFNLEPNSGEILQRKQYVLISTINPLINCAVGNRWFWTHLVTMFSVFLHYKQIFLGNINLANYLCNVFVRIPSWHEKWAVWLRSCRKPPHTCVGGDYTKWSLKRLWYSALKCLRAIPCFDFPHG